MTVCETCGQPLLPALVRHWQVLNPAGAACGAQSGVVTVDRGRVDYAACQHTAAWTSGRNPS